MLDETADVNPFPPAIVTVLSLAFAVYDPLSPAIPCNTFWTTLGEEFVIVKLSPATSVDIPVPPTKLIVVDVLLAVLVLTSVPITVNTFWSGAPKDPVIAIVTVSPAIEVEMFEPPAIVKVSVAADAVVEPLSALIVSNKFCVVPPPPPEAVSSLAGYQ